MSKYRPPIKKAAGKGVKITLSPPRGSARGEVVTRSGLPVVTLFAPSGFAWSASDGDSDTLFGETLADSELFWLSLSISRDASL